MSRALLCSGLVVLALAAAGGGTSSAADYDASVTGTEPESDDVQLRTVERRPGHW